MKKKIGSVGLATMLCIGMMFSANAKATSSHAGCEHMIPPSLVEEYDGYKYNSVHHWKQYTTVARCNACGMVLDVVSKRTDSKGPHVFVRGFCTTCHYEK